MARRASLNPIFLPTYHAKESSGIPPLLPTRHLSYPWSRRDTKQLPPRICNNTLQIALGNGTGAVKVPHRGQFDAQAVKRQLGIAISSWDAFMVRTKALAERKVSDAAAEAFFRRVLTYRPQTTATAGGPSLTSGQ